MSGLKTAAAKISETDQSKSISDYFADSLAITIRPETSIKDSYGAANTAIGLFSNRFMQMPKNLTALLLTASPQHTDAGLRRKLIDSAASAIRTDKCLVYRSHVEALLDIVKNERDLYVRATALDLATESLIKNETLCTAKNMQALLEIAGDEEHIAYMLPTGGLIPEPADAIVRCKALEAIMRLSTMLPSLRTKENFDALLKISVTDLGAHIIKVEGLFCSGLDSRAAHRNGNYIQSLASQAAFSLYENEPDLRTPDNLAAYRAADMRRIKSNDAHEELRRAKHQAWIKRPKTNLAASRG